MSGIHPKPLGNYLAAQPVPNAWRVLRADGSVAPEFRWSDPDRTDPPRAVLAAEGVQFDDRGVPSPHSACRLGELAALLGLEVPEDAAGTGGGEVDHEQRFWIQLRASQSAATVDAIERLTDDWRNRGGYLDWGNGAQAVAFPSVRAGGEQYWPWTIRPTTGTVEVVFQHLLTRPPFGDTALRDELRRRINRIPGVDLPLSRLELRPSFPVTEARGLDRDRLLRAPDLVKQVREVNVPVPTSGRADGPAGDPALRRSPPWYTTTSTSPGPSLPSRAFAEIAPNSFDSSTMPLRSGSA